jgi:serine protease AprX
MVKEFVSVYFMNEQEKQRASELMPGATETEGFLIGEADEDVEARLRDARLIFQSYPESWKPPVPESERLTPQAAARKAREAVIDTMDINPAPRDFYRVVLRGPVIEPWRNQLEAMDVKLGDALPGGGYRVRLALSDLPRVQILAFVASVNWIQPSESAPTVVTPAAVGVVETGQLLFDVRLNSPEFLGKVAQWLTERNTTIVGMSGRKIRISAEESAPVLNELATMPEIDTISEYVQPKAFNDVARVILDIDSFPNSPAGAVPVGSVAQDGSGQIVAVADTGIDDKHPDFRGRIIGKVALGRPNDTSDPNGHGTHVAGSVLGDGAASGGKVRGTAPKAELFFQSLLDAKGGLGGLPLDLNDLFLQAYKSGARIHNNSWGAATPSCYTMNSEEVDEFVRNNPDMLIVIAAGNAGTSAKPLHSNLGFVDWLSIGSPASSKNALTVGACRSHRTDGAFANRTWGRVWPIDFPLDPIKSECISGDAESMAAFSSRGPIDDHRVKPDLVAPGTDIASTRSSIAPLSNFWGPYPATQPPPQDPQYAYDGGTSMATPLVSGCAALVRQYYVDERKHVPSASLLKATLINSTVWLSGKDAIADPQGEPNYHQGFGRVSIVRAIPNKQNTQFIIEFLDDWQKPQASLLRTGERRRYHFALAANAQELRICLAYTDPPARALQNNVNLIVQHLASGTKFVGNARLPNALTQLDTTNNVESVCIPTPPEGDYIIQIVASNLLKPPQDFAVVVSGTGISQLNRIP